MFADKKSWNQIIITLFEFEEASDQDNQWLNVQRPAAYRYLGTWKDKDQIIGVAVNIISVEEW